MAEFRDRPLDGGPLPLLVDRRALTQQVREGRLRLVQRGRRIATALPTRDAERSSASTLSPPRMTSWTEFLRGLVARGLSGVELVISDAHGGIKAAIALVLAEASWQRCRTHFMANLASRVPKANWPMMATLVRSIFEQPDRDATWAQLGDVIDKLTATGFVDPAVYILDAADDIPPLRPSRPSTGPKSGPITRRNG